MKGDDEIIEVLNEVLTAELTAINQYYVHFKMCADWGYDLLAAKKREESIEEMKHADVIIERILFLDGVPNMQRMNPVKVGQDPIEQHKVDLALELDARERLNRGIKLAREKGDDGTRQILSEILESEEDGIDWLETHLKLAEDLGKERYLAQMIRG